MNGGTASRDGDRRWPWPIDVTARVLPFAVFIAFLLAADLAAHFVDSVGGGWDARWLPVTRGLLVGMLLLLFHRQYVELRGVAGTSPKAWLTGLLVGIAVFVAWVALDQPWLRMDGASAGFVPVGPDGRVDVTLAALRLVGMVIIVPVMEELFWRSFLLRWLTARAFLKVDPKTVSRAAFAMTAVLFALAHDLWLAGLVAGMAYGWLYVHFRNLWIPIVAHGLTNALLGAYVLATGSWRLW